MTAPDPNLEWPISYQAVLEVARSEGCRLKAYRCPAGVPTIGWGHTGGVKMGDTCTQEQADAWFCVDLMVFSNSVLQELTVEPSESELGALVSFAYNVGVGGFKRSTVLKRHNEGDRQSAARAFALWNQATVNGVKQVLPGLTARRAREAALYLSDEAAEMPQEVVPESGLGRSPIVLGGATTVLAGLGGLASMLPEILAQGEAVSLALGANPIVGVSAALIWAGVKAILSRTKQRREGWA